MIYIRTICIVIAIFIVLATLVFFEQFVVRGFCNEISHVLSSAEKSISGGNNPVQDVSRTVKIWEEKKALVFIFSNHSNFREIENSIYNLEFHSQKGNVKKAQFCVNALSHRVHELKESCRFKKENIL